MSVSVRIPTILRTYTGGESEVSAEGADLAAVLEDLDAKLRRHQGPHPRRGRPAAPVRQRVRRQRRRALPRQPEDPDARRHPDLGDPGRRRRLTGASHETAPPAVDGPRRAGRRPPAGTWRHPARPGRERVPELYAHGAGQVGGGVRRPRTHVDHPLAASCAVGDLVDVGRDRGTWPPRAGVLAVEPGQVPAVRASPAGPVRCFLHLSALAHPDLFRNPRLTGDSVTPRPRDVVAVDVGVGDGGDVDAGVLGRPLERGRGPGAGRRRGRAHRHARGGSGCRARAPRW